MSGGKILGATCSVQFNERSRATGALVRPVGLDCSNGDPTRPEKPLRPCLIRCCPPFNPLSLGWRRHF